VSSAQFNKINAMKIGSFCERKMFFSQKLFFSSQNEKNIKKTQKTPFFEQKTHSFSKIMNVKM